MNPLKTADESDQIIYKNNEGTIRILQKEARQAFVSDKKVMLMDFNYKGIDWKTLDSHGERESWRHTFLECVEGSSWTSRAQPQGKTLQQYVISYLHTIAKK